MAEERQVAPIIFHIASHIRGIRLQSFNMERCNELSTINYVHKNILIHCQFKTFLEECDGDEDVIYFSKIE